jgi:hypothetical protein
LHALFAYVCSYLCNCCLSQDQHRNCSAHLDSELLLPLPAAVNVLPTPLPPMPQPLSMSGCLPIFAQMRRLGPRPASKL